jgi:hypothetical protein
MMEAAFDSMAGICRCGSIHHWTLLYSIFYCFKLFDSFVVYKLDFTIMNTSGSPQLMRQPSIKKNSCFATEEQIESDVRRRSRQRQKLGRYLMISGTSCISGAVRKLQ